MAFNYHPYGRGAAYGGNYPMYSPAPNDGLHDATMHEERMEAPVSPPTMMDRQAIPHRSAHAYALPPAMPQSPLVFLPSEAQASYLMAPPSPYPQMNFTGSRPTSGSTNNTRRSGVRFMPKGQMGRWHRDEDISYRRLMMAEISKVLRLQSKGHAGSESESWLRKQSQMVKRLEVSLYKSAPSLEAYVDPSTLRQRLQELKEDIKMRSHAEAMLGLQKNASTDCYETRGEGQDTSRSEEP